MDALDYSPDTWSNKSSSTPYIIDLPYPVGKITKVSLPETKLLIPSTCSSTAWKGNVVLMLNLLAWVSIDVFLSLKYTFPVQFLTPYQVKFTPALYINQSISQSPLRSGM